MCNFEIIIVGFTLKDICFNENKAISVAKRVKVWKSLVILFFCVEKLYFSIPLLILFNVKNLFKFA